MADHRSESPRTATAESIDLGMAARIVQGGDQADINTAVFNPSALYRNPAEFAGQARTGGSPRGEVPVAKLTGGIAGVDDMYGGSAGAERGELPVAMLTGGIAGAERGELPLAKLTGGLAGVEGKYGDFAAGAERGELPVSMLTVGVAGVDGKYDGVAGAGRGELPAAKFTGSIPGVDGKYGGVVGAERGELAVAMLIGSVSGAERGELHNAMLTGGIDGVDGKYGGVGGVNCSGSFAAGRATGIMDAHLASNMAERMRLVLRVVGVIATSTAVTGLMMSGAGTVTPAAGLGLFALLLAGMWAIMIHVLHA